MDSMNLDSKTPDQLADIIIDALEVCARAGIDTTAFTLQQAVHSLARATDPRNARSQGAMDEMLDYVTDAAGGYEEAAETLRDITAALGNTPNQPEVILNELLALAETFEHRAEHLDDMVVKYGVKDKA